MNQNLFKAALIALACFFIFEASSHRYCDVARRPRPNICNRYDALDLLYERCGEDIEIIRVRYNSQRQYFLIDFHDRYANRRRKKIYFSC